MGRVQSLSSSGLTDIGRHLKQWYSKLPGFFTDSMSANVVSWSFNDVPTGNPGGTDGAVFACFGTPSFGMGAVGWNYGTYTWHTKRDRSPGTRTANYGKVPRKTRPRY
jgi:hypothetical protein